jgi:hypothetical protein
MLGKMSYRKKTAKENLIHCQVVLCLNLPGKSVCLSHTLPNRTFRNCIYCAAAPWRPLTQPPYSRGKGNGQSYKRRSHNELFIHCNNIWAGGRFLFLMIYVLTSYGNSS